MKGKPTPVKSAKPSQTPAKAANPQNLPVPSATGGMQNQSAAPATQFPDEMAEKFSNAAYVGVSRAQVGLEFTNKMLVMLEQNPVPFLDTVLSLVEAVLSLIAQAYANRAQLAMISERITVIVPFLTKLKTLKCNQNIILAVNEFAAIVKDCQDQAAVYAQRNWFKRIFASGTDQKKFEDLLSRLNNSIAHIDLGLAVEQTQILENLAARETVDNLAIRDNYQEIIRLEELSLKEIQANRKEQQEFFLDQKEQNNIIGLQLQSASTELLSRLKLSDQDRQQFMEREFSLLHKKFSELDLRSTMRKPPISAHLVVPFHEINFVKVIKKGSFGTVYLGEWRGVKVAVKKVGKRLNKAQYEQFIREMKIMARLRNPHITQLYGACLEPEACLVMEYAANKSLDHYLAANSISLIKKITIGAGIAKGLHHLHESEVLHRDLKPGNVLIDEHGVPKLTDFGLSKTLDRSIGTINDRTDAIAWMAPEAIGAKSIHTTKSEVYSFGLVLWCLMTEQQPFADIPEEKLVAEKRAGCYVNVPDAIPAEIRKIILACLEPEPNKRPPLERIIAQLEAYLSSQQLSPEKMCEQGLAAETDGDFANAYKHYLSSARNGFFRAKTNLASLLLQGKGCSPNGRQAYQLLLEAANAGHVRAMTNLGSMLLQGYGVEANAQEAKKWLTLAAEKGSSEAQALLDSARGFDGQPLYS
jgi:tRNA A-37 threonylcarbamoyl transferase component Bud32